MPLNRPLASETVDATAVWLLTIQWRGKEYRWSTIPINVSKDDGSTLPYRGELGNAPDIEEAVSTGRFNGGSVPFEVDFGEDLLDAFALGYRLSTARGQLDMVTTRDRKSSVQTWESRYRYLSGRISLPQAARRGDSPGLARFSVEQTATQDMGRVLVPLAIINDTTWASPPTDSVGKVYPLVIGRAGQFQVAPTSSTTSGAPAYVVADTGGSADTLLVGYGHWSATQAVLFHDSGNTTLSVTATHDLIGNPCMTMDVSGQSAAIRTSGSYYTGISSGSGFKLPYEDSDHRGAGDWVRWMVERSTLDVDYDSWSAVTPWLNGFAKLATVIVDPDVSPSEWLVDNALDILPIETIMGPDGVSAILDEIEYLPAAALAINEGPDFRYVGPIVEKLDATELVTSYTLRYGKRVKTGDYKNQTTIAADSSPPTADMDLSLPVVNAAQVGGQAVVVDDTDIICDRASGRRVAHYKARKLSEQPLWADFMAADRYGGLTPGDSISLTWSDKSIADAVGRIEMKSRSESMWVYTVKFPLGLAGHRG